MLIGMCFYHAGILWLSLFETAFAICPSGTKLFDLPDGTQDCKFCSDCPRGSVKVNNCSIYKDTVCKPACGKSSYYIDNEPHCITCTVCGPGHKVVRKCSQFDNTVCEKCQEGTFSELHNSSFCRNCSTCEGKVISKKCTSTTDSVCNDTSPLAVIVGVIIGFAVLILIVVILIFLWRRRNSRRATKRNNGLDTSKNSSRKTINKGNTGISQESEPLISKEDQEKDKKQFKDRLHSLPKEKQLDLLSLCVCKLTRPTVSENIKDFKASTENTHITDHLENKNEQLQHKDQDTKYTNIQMLNLKTNDESKDEVLKLVSSEEYHEETESQQPQDVNKIKQVTFRLKPLFKTKTKKNTEPKSKGKRSNKKCPSHDKNERKTSENGEEDIAKTKISKRTITNAPFETGHESSIERVPLDEETEKESTGDHITNLKTNNSKNTTAAEVLPDNRYSSNENHLSRIKVNDKEQTHTQPETSNDKMQVDKESGENENHRSKEEDIETNPTNEHSSNLRFNSEIRNAKHDVKRKTPPSSNDIMTNSMTKTSKDTLPDKVTQGIEIDSSFTALGETCAAQITATFVGSRYLITSNAALELLLGSRTGADCRVSNTFKEICTEYLEKNSKELRKEVRAFEIVYTNEELNVAILELKDPLGNNQSLFLCKDRSAEYESKCNFLTGKSQIENVDVNDILKNHAVPSFLNKNLRDSDNYKKIVSMSDENSNSYLFWTSENHISSGSPGIFFSEVDKMFNMHCVATTECQLNNDYNTGKCPAKNRLNAGTYMYVVYDDMEKRKLKLTKALFF